MRRLPLLPMARLAVIVPFAALLHSPSPALAQVSLGAAADFALLGGSAITCTDSFVTGDLGISPGTALTQTNCSISGTVQVGDTVAQQANTDFLAAYDVLGLVQCGTTLAVLSGQTLLPGVYCVSAAATEAGVLTLVGSSTDTWIFKIGTSGTGALTGTGFSVVMTGGQPCNNNVFWWTAEAATLTDSVFLGSILAGTSVTVTRGSFNGQALAKAAATLTNANVSVAAPIVTGAGAGVFPAGAVYLGLPLSSLSLGMGLGVACNWAEGQFQVTLTGTVLGVERNIVVKGQVTARTTSPPGTASFSGTSTVDPGDGTPLLPAVPFVASVAANADGTGSLTLSLGGTNLPAAAIDEGYLSVQ